MRLLSSSGSQPIEVILKDVIYAPSTMQFTMNGLRILLEEYKAFIFDIDQNVIATAKYDGNLLITSVTPLPTDPHFGANSSVIDSTQQYQIRPKDAELYL